MLQVQLPIATTTQIVLTMSLDFVANVVVAFLGMAGFAYKTVSKRSISSD